MLILFIGRNMVSIQFTCGNKLHWWFHYWFSILNVKLLVVYRNINEHYIVITYNIDIVC